jgi:DNA-binding transcriptional MerR regulator
MAVTERFKAPERELEGGSGATALTIQEVSRRSGLSEPTLRYYEKIGLVEHVERDESSGHRRYGPAVVARIEALACLRTTGMSVQDLRLYLANLGEGTQAAGEMHELFARNVARLDAEIERLRVRRTYLRMKAEMWAARRDGDEARERRAVEAVLNAMDELR